MTVASQNEPPASDIVERLQRFAKEGAGIAVLIDAAAEIELLRAALKPFVRAFDNAEAEGFKYHNVTVGAAADQLSYQDFERAASALTGRPQTAAGLQYSHEQLLIGVQYIDWDEKLNTATEVRQLGEAISRMGGPAFDLDAQMRGPSVPRSREAS